MRESHWSRRVGGEVQGMLMCCALQDSQASKVHVETHRNGESSLLSVPKECPSILS